MRSYTLRALRRLGIALASTFILVGPAAVRAADHPDLFRLMSPDFADNGSLSAANAGTGTSPRGDWACGGQNVTPALAWTHAPNGTKSFAVLMDDPDAASGLGANHWIAYDIPAAVTGLPRDAGSGRSPLLTEGANGRKLPQYSGPCSEPDAKPHHFLWLVYALDLAPGTLKPGLTQEEFMQQIRGHNLAEASLTATYEQHATPSTAK
jgi:Raf kinase inhibitor-like YbhB/YbcL family protein